MMCLICTCSPPYSTRPFGNSLTLDFIGTPKLSGFGREHSEEENKTVRAWSGLKADNIVLRRSRD
ncbi:hypothetical protein DVH24_006568 [Malus domestica]|uniref:Uncharacterized protein n=1 Tax=Malus domestica TaxID=3750 RepID=A0A498KD26_MALDO|nr:hypothetical protein DVH24_006568 [Malus domestica]